MLNNAPQNKEVSKERRDRDRGVSKQKEFSAGVGMIVFRRSVEGPKFLVMYHRGTYWNFPKGQIEPGETPIETAIRELKEETGLTQKDIHIKKGFRVEERYRFSVGKKKIDRVVTLFLAETTKKGIDISAGNREEGFAWFLQRDAKKIFENYKESQAALRKAADFIRGNRPQTTGPSPSKRWRRQRAQRRS